MRMDLNSDVGESFGPWQMGQDAAVIPAITSANIACGFHAGDPGVMRETVALARAAGVAVGAHPGFPDLAGFGRRDMRCSPQEVEDLVVYQVAALAGVAARQGIRLQHVKAHGALYNMACRDRALADAVARGASAVDSNLILFGLPDSELLRAGQRAGLGVAAEVFADRAYEPDGSLMSRAKAGSVIHDERAVVTRAIRMARERVVTAIDGTDIALQADTLCLHGDTPGAATLAAAIRHALEREGVRVLAVGTETSD